MPKPIIGITANTVPAAEHKTEQVTISQTYLEAVTRAGGVPVILPPQLEGESLEAALKRLDGVMLSGGSDIDPTRFNGVPHPRVYGIDPARDEMEVQLVRLAAAQGKPFLGICRGIQSVNVALGGTLFTDIGDQLEGAHKHDFYPDYPRDYLAHTVEVLPQSRLRAILGAQEVWTNSLHHQGIQALAPGLQPAACSPDGLVEGVELPNHPFGVAVQWHPECLQQHAEHRALFQSFIQAAAGR